MSVHLPKHKDGRAKSPFWHYDFVVNGRRFHGSTGETTRAKAERVERQKRAEALQPRDDTSITGAFGLWWEERGKHLAKPDTVFDRLETLQDLLGEVLRDDRQPETLGAIRTRHLTTYVGRRRAQLTRRDRPFKPASINREIQLLRALMRYAVDAWEKEDIRLPNFGKALLEEPAEIVVEISEAEQAALKRHLREDFHDALDWLVLSGTRVSNALEFRADQVDFERRTVTFRVKSKKPGGRPIVLPITGPMLVILANNIHNSPAAVFTYVARRTRAGRVRGERYPITYGAFYTAFKAAAKAIGKPSLRVHDLRHTAATRTLRATQNLKLASRQLGHTRISTTERYAHVLDDDLRSGMEDSHNPRKIPGTAPDAGANELDGKAKSK